MLSQVAHRGGRCPTSAPFQARLFGSLGNVLQLQMSLLTAGRLDWMTLKEPFQPKAFHNSTREELLYLFGALGSGLASAGCGKGSWEHGEEQHCCQGGRGGGDDFSSPAHISAVVIHRSVTGTSVQRHRSNPGPAEPRNCFQSCRFPARGCGVSLTAGWRLAIYFVLLFLALFLAGSREQPHVKQAGAAVWNPGFPLAIVWEGWASWAPS